MTRRARTLALLFVVVALVAAGAFVARQRVRQALFLIGARRATGLAIDVARVAADDGAYDLTGLQAHTPGGALLLEAAHAHLTVRGGDVAIAFDAPRITLDPERLRAGEARRVLDALERWHAGAAERIAIRGGTLTIVRGEIPEPIAQFDDATADLEARGSHLDYDVSANLVDRGARYGIAGRSTAGADGAPMHVWRAALLPLEAFGPLASDAPALRPAAGWLRDVELDAGTTLHGTLRLDDASVGLGSHALQALHGIIAFDGDGAGSPGIAGALDGTVPFEYAGEVRGLHDPSAGTLGGRDLQAVVALASTLAAEPHLRSVRIEAIAPGLAFGQYAVLTAHGPLAISVLSIDPAEPTLRFDTALAEDHVVSGGERTSAMGLRTGAVAGVNGDYFDIGRTYQPQGMLVRGGKLVRGPTDRAVLAIDASKHVTFGEYRLVGELKTPRGTMPVTEFNDWPPGNVAVITPDYGKSLRPASNATFVALVPVAAGGTRYRVTAVVPSGGVAPALGVGIGALVRTAPPRVGDLVELSYRLEPSLGDAVAAIGGGPILLRDGAWYDDPHAPAPDERDVRWPVIALARAADDRLLLVAVDGRHPERSIGATRPEFARILQRLGAIDAMALDSGGSVTLVARKPGDATVSVRNVVSDFSAERWISDGLFLYSSAPPPALVPPRSAPTPVPEARPTP